MTNYTFHHDGEKPSINQRTVFVFGSNLRGVHGAGAAKEAYDSYGAEWGKGKGYVGKSYALPTKDNTLSTLPLEVIKEYVDGFLQFARAHPELDFFVTRVGCGLAGYKDYQIAPLFRGAPENCNFALQWLKLIQVGEHKVKAKTDLYATVLDAVKSKKSHIMRMIHTRNHQITKLDGPDRLALKGEIGRIGKIIESLRAHGGEGSEGYRIAIEAVQGANRRRHAQKVRLKTLAAEQVADKALLAELNRFLDTKKLPL